MGYNDTCLAYRGTTNSIFVVEFFYHKMDTKFASIPNCTASHPKRPYSNHCCEDLKFHLKVYETIRSCARIEVLTVVLLRIQIFWEVMLCH
jgi:hypothetical protein